MVLEQPGVHALLMESVGARDDSQLLQEQINGLRFPSTKYKQQKRHRIKMLPFLILVSCDKLLPLKYSNIKLVSFIQY